MEREPAGRVFSPDPVKVFIDVGAHRGQSLEAAKELDFGKIFCFEPVSVCWPDLDRLADKRVRIQKFGLWNKNARVPLIDPGTKGASMWVKDKRPKDRPIVTQLCEFRRASTWFSEFIAPKWKVYLKINCEGCEADILDDLLDSDEFDKVAFLMIDYDAHKSAEIKHREVEIASRLAAFPAPRVMSSKQAMKGATHKERIHHWLGMCQ